MYGNFDIVLDPSSRRFKLRATPHARAVWCSLFHTYAYRTLACVCHLMLWCRCASRLQDNSWCDPFKTAVAIFAADPLEGFKSEADMNRVSQQQHPSPAAFAAMRWISAMSS